MPDVHHDNMSLNHPIVEQSFAIIDREIGTHSFASDQYEVVRRVIHSTADFEFKDLITFSPHAIEQAIAMLQNRVPIVVDVNMVRQGVQGMVDKTFQNPIYVAVNHAQHPSAGKTRTESGMMHCLRQHPDSIVVVGNAPTALLAICHAIQAKTANPCFIVGAPVGFVSVLESKAALSQLNTHQVLVSGRKGGSPVAAAIINALLALAWRNQ